MKWGRGLAKLTVATAFVAAAVTAVAGSDWDDNLYDKYVPNSAQNFGSEKTDGFVRPAPTPKAPGE